MIGQAIAKRHIAEGDEVDIYDNCSNPFVDYEHLHGWYLPFVKGCYPDLAAYDLISNQAAYVGVGESMYLPNKYMVNNLDATTKIIQELITKKSDVPIIHAGSMGPYGEGPRLCHHCGKYYTVNTPREHVGAPECPDCGERSHSMHIKETDQLNPVSYYGISKKVQEDSLKLYYDTYNVRRITSLRYFSVYSSDQNPTNPRTGVLTIIANQIINNDKILLNEDGHQTRDLVHVDDIAQAHYLASRYLVRGFHVFNIGTGRETRLEDVALGFVNHMELPISTIQFTGTIRKGDVYNSRADISKAKDMLGYEPKHKLYEDIKSYADYVMENKEKFKSDSWKEENQKVKEHGLQ